MKEKPATKLISKTRGHQTPNLKKMWYNDISTTHKEQGDSVAENVYVFRTENETTKITDEAFWQGFEHADDFPFLFITFIRLDVFPTAEKSKEEHNRRSTRMAESKDLYILWTNADPHTSQLMVMMYARNSMLNNWWNRVTVILWGATVKLIADNDMIQDQYKIAAQAGVKFSACISCAQQLGVVEKLKDLDIEMLPWGEPFTDILKSGDKLITI